MIHTIEIYWESSILYTIFFTVILVTVIKAKLREDMPAKCQWWVVTFSPQSDGNNGSKVGAGHQVCSWSGSWHEKVSYKKRSG